MDAKHTPGPWAVYDGPRDRAELTVCTVERSGQILTVADCRQLTIPPRQQEANARLIAAAPELLEACDNAGGMLANWRKVIARVMEEGRGLNPSGLANLEYNMGLQIAELRAVIMKATGKG